MVEADIDDSAFTGRIILRPNASWSWQANLYLLYTLTGISLVISLAFMLMGAWLVLPWSGGALIVLAACTWYCVRQCNRQEVITLSEDEVVIERGIRAPRERRTYQRTWAQFLIKPAAHPWDPAMVSIRSRGEEDEIGSFLNSADKAKLITVIRKLVAAYQAAR